MTPIYKASDGSEHKTAAAAAKHERVLTAAREFEAAAKAYERAVGESILTADGEHFDMRTFRSYWRVRRRYGEIPTVEEVSVYPHGLNIDRSKGRVLVRWFTNGDRYTTHPIAELYADKRNAELARVEVMKQDLAAMAEAVRVATNEKGGA